MAKRASKSRTDTEISHSINKINATLNNLATMDGNAPILKRDFNVAGWTWLLSYHNVNVYGGTLEDPEMPAYTYSMVKTSLRNLSEGEDAAFELTERRDSTGRVARHYGTRLQAELAAADAHERELVRVSGILKEKDALVTQVAQELTAATAQLKAATKWLKTCGDDAESLLTLEALALGEDNVLASAEALAERFGS